MSRYIRLTERTNRRLTQRYGVTYPRQRAVEMLLDEMMTDAEWLEMVLITINRCPRMAARATVILDLKEPTILGLPIR